jgi:hypothetical protein
MPFGYEQPPQPQQPAHNPWTGQAAVNAQKGESLVRLSRWLLLGGCVLMFGSCGGGIALQFFPLSIGGVVIGSLVITAAAVVGSVGRGMQGRII